MVTAQEADPNSIIVDNADGLKVARKKLTIDSKGNSSPTLADRMATEMDVFEEVESGPPASQKKRRKSVFIRVWKYVKESWLGVMSGTGIRKSAFYSNFELRKTF